MIVRACFVPAMLVSVIALTVGRDGSGATAPLWAIAAPALLALAGATLVLLCACCISALAAVSPRWSTVSSLPNLLSDTAPSSIKVRERLCGNARRRHVGARTSPYVFCWLLHSAL